MIVIESLPGAMPTFRVKIGFRLPHPTCAFLNRYLVNELEYFFLCIATDDGTTTLLRWFQWSLRQGWDAILTYRVAGQGDAIQRTTTYQTTNTDPEHRRLLFGTTIATINANLYLIYERGGAVETDERPPAPTLGQTGLMRVHPMAPSSVIRIRVNDPRLLHPTEPRTPPPVSEPPTEPTDPQEPVLRRPARGTTVHYRHPRYVNMQGKIGHRRAQHGHPDADQPQPPTYKAEDD